MIENHLTKIKDLEANLKDNDKYNKKWTVYIMFHKKLIKTKSSKKMLFIHLSISFYVDLFIYLFIYLHFFHIIISCFVQLKIPLLFYLSQSQYNYFRMTHQNKVILERLNRDSKSCCSLMFVVFF